MVGNIANLVRHEPEAVALVGEGRTVTYGQLDARSSAVAVGLAALGIRRGGRVAYLAPNRPEFFEMLIGVAKLAAVLVPVNWRLTDAEIAAIVADAEAEVLLVDPRFADLAAVVAAAAGDRLRAVVELGEDYESWLNAQPAVEPIRPSPVPRRCCSSTPRARPAYRREC